MATPQAIELARLKMIEAQKALEDYRNTNGFNETPEHRKLAKAFSVAVESYQKLSGHQGLGI